MRYRDLLVERNVNKTQFSAILSDSTIRMGFECEMVLSIDDVATTGSAPVDPNDFEWDDLKKWIDFGTYEERKLGEALHEYGEKRVSEKWDAERKSYTLKWCKRHGKTADDDDGDMDEDEREDALIDEFGDEAEEAWREGEDAYDYGDVDEMIASEYGSNGQFLRYVGFDPIYGWADDGDIYTEASSGGNAVREQAGRELSRLFGKPCEVYHRYGNDKTDGAWTIETDSSIETEGEGEGAEIVSPVYGLTEGLNAMKKLFKWMNSNGHTTNDSTGLHVTVSIDGKVMQDYDYLKMLLFFDERYTAALFDRLDNEYCFQMQTKLHELMANTEYDGDLTSHVISSRDLPLVTRYLKALGAGIRTNFDRYVTFNSRDNGAFECRAMGGDSYEDRFEDIRKRVVNLAAVLKLGCDSTAYAKDYVQKVVALLTRNKYDPEAKTAYDPAKIYGLEAFKPLMREHPQFVNYLRDDHKLFVTQVAIRLATNEVPITRLMVLQLRKFVRHIGYTPDDARRARLGDSYYNVLAKLMNWPVRAPAAPKGQGVLGIVEPSATDYDRVVRQDAIRATNDETIERGRTRSELRRNQPDMFNN